MTQNTKNNTPQNPLGLATSYNSDYDPSLLFAIARKEKREELSIEETLPFAGEDIWNAYEISWLNDLGLPQVAIGEFRFNASSESIVESKSLKLYLNSLNQSQFTCLADVEAVIKNDLDNITGSKVKVKLSNLDAINEIKALKAKNIDDQPIQISQYRYQPDLLKIDQTFNLQIVEESLSSHLLKSNCLITNQPDWASILIQYKGHKICEESLLKYIVSFRTHNEFHEQCVERIYVDIMKFCQPECLTVYARYTRRGGLDINPWRSNYLSTMDNIRLSRQ